MGDNTNKKIRKEMDAEEQARREAMLAKIAEELPPIVWRNWKRWRDVLPFAPLSVANDYSRGIGPKEFIFSGRVKGYPKDALLDYARGKMRFDA